MKYCTHCGKEITDEAVVCINCGCAIDGGGTVRTGSASADVPSAGLNILSLLIPLVGLILYITMHAQTPRKANQLGIFALVGFVVNLVLIYGIGLFSVMLV